MRQLWLISTLLKSLHMLLVPGKHYRPERHYMRGPGPAWRARQTQRRPPR